MTKSSFIDPSSLSLPSPSNSSDFSVSTPTPSTATLETVSEAGPSRKRARTETSSEDRKEARAHRNRIAAQNSRDRRKAQFSYLERRVVELEEENRQLRAGFAGGPSSRFEERKASEEKERERARERENEELKERIKTLEKGWDAVVKALAAQGLPTGISPTPKSEPSSTPVESTTTTSSSTTSSQTTSPMPKHNPTPLPSSTHTLPVLPLPTVFPISPAPSHSSLDFDLDLSTPGSLFSDEFPTSTGGDHRGTSPLGVPAAGGLSLPSLSLDHVESNQHSEEPQSTIDVDDAIMEDLFREILAPSPCSTTSPLPIDASVSTYEVASSSPAASTAQVITSQGNTAGVRGGVEMSVGLDAVVGSVNWANEAEMQRILDMLPNTADVEVGYNLSELELGWELENFESASGMVGVF